MNYILFDPSHNDHLLPFTFLRPFADIRIGILTIREKWEKLLNTQTYSLTRDYLQAKYPLKTEKLNILINGSVCPDNCLIEAIHKLSEGQVLICGPTVIAALLSDIDTINFNDNDVKFYEKVTYKEGITQILNLWDIFTLNGKCIEEDFKLLTEGRKSAILNESNRIKCEGSVFVEEGAIVECSVINASTGPVYIGKNAEIMEGCLIRGPLALCEGATLKMGAKIYGPTTIGPYCKVGGEVNNSVFFAYSNKAHDGFIGNSVIGEWCNIGADSNNSNLKNNYDLVKIWNYPKQNFINTGLQFCGLFMGDHSKCGINTMFNTGTVVGVSSNIFGTGFMRNFIPSFSWGGPSGFTNFQLNKAIEVARRVYERRNKKFDEIEESIFVKVYDMTQKYREQQFVV